MTPAGELALNQWALDGEWSVGAEAAVLESAGGAIAYRFEGRDLNLVLGRAGAPVALHRAPRRRAARRRPRARRRRVRRGHAVDEPRMYQLVRQRGPVRQRTFEITFDGPGVRAYVFTFG